MPSSCLEPCTYQDPATITREQASTGDIYTVPLGKSTSKNVCSNLVD